MRTVVIAGGTRGIGGALASRLRAGGDEVVALGSADADLSSVAATRALLSRLPGRVDVLVLAAGRFSQRRVVTAEGLEQTFAIGVMARFLLAEGLRAALARSAAPVVVSLCGTGGIRAGRIHWDDLQLERGYRLFTATMQGARANDLLGVGFVAREPRIPYVLYNPLMVDSGMHRYLDQPGRAVMGVAARWFGESVGRAAARLEGLLAAPPSAPLTAWRRGTPVVVSGSGFDPVAAARLYGVLADLAG
ncbi:hypothetical protein [Actinoplanes sp. NPDC051851]|uniref:hypothetical protein n=1 Tax=Actinoplanes sp. NPDC051851 TaxID=3154753 RepID=UPI00342E3242